MEKEKLKEVEEKKKITYTGSKFQGKRLSVRFQLNGNDLAFWLRLPKAFALCFSIRIHNL